MMHIMDMILSFSSYAKIRNAENIILYNCIITKKPLALRICFKTEKKKVAELSKCLAFMSCGKQGGGGGSGGGISLWNFCFFWSAKIPALEYFSRARSLIFKSITVYNFLGLLK